MKAWIVAKKVGDKHYGWCLSKNTAGRATEGWLRNLSRVNKFLIESNAVNIAQRKPGAFVMKSIEFERVVHEENEKN